MRVTAVYHCGCWISVERDRKGDTVKRVIHCNTHGPLFSPDKTLNQMADEIRLIAQRERKASV